jgi:hypothetical protein
MKKRSLLLLLCAWLPACAFFQRPPRPVHASPQEAASFKWPEVLPYEGHQLFSGITLAAIQLAMDDFLPWDTQPHKGATPREICLYKRESYDVNVVPGAENLVYVQIFPREGACESADDPIALDGGATYALDTRHWRILAVMH